ncbi:hypothetical protein REPUB_Repub15cG0093300 [Reevesia pubescens]
MVMGENNTVVGEEINEDIIDDLDVLELYTDDEVNNTIKKHSLVEKEKRRVMAQSPWSVMNYHMILKEWPSEATVEEIDFSTTEMWLQIHNVPLAYLTISNVDKIAMVFHGLVELDFENDKGIKWNGFLRMDVVIKVDEPLKVGFSLKRMDNKSIGAFFKYERLSNFCYHYGRLSHGANKCCYRLDGRVNSKSEVVYDINLGGNLMMGQKSDADSALNENGTDGQQRTLESR